VTTLLSAADEGAADNGSTAVASVDELEAAVAEQGAVVKAAKAKAKDTGEEADKQASKAAIDQLLQLKQRLGEAQAAAPPSLAPGEVDYSRDFFGKPAYLTVSGQLNGAVQPCTQCCRYVSLNALRVWDQDSSQVCQGAGEMCACALGDIYTFGPTFRAEQSNTARHLAEFWMVEPEMAFADLSDDISCAEAYLKFCVQYVLDNCKEDIKFFDSRIEKGLIARLKAITERPFVRITYTEAVDLLLASGQKFEFPVEWGRDLQSEHERWLTEKAFQGVPVAVTDYPKGIKAFYMRLNDDGKTVAAMDVLVPKVGELMGGSQREDRMDVLVARLQEVCCTTDPPYKQLTSISNQVLDRSICSIAKYVYLPQGLQELDPTQGSVPLI
jgi:asparaginyl-tRNA synthetase